MPGVRYGPDISDDAAYLMESIALVNERLAKSKAARLTAELNEELDYYKEAARKLFGVSERDFKRGRFGDLAELAKYGGKGRYSKPAKGRKGEMRKSVAQEMMDRGSRRVPRDGTSTRTLNDPYFVGRTATQRFKSLEQRAARRAVRNGLSFTRASASEKTKNAAAQLVRGKITANNFRAKLDEASIARPLVGGKASKTSRTDLINRARGPRASRVNNKTLLSIRPILPKSEQRRGQARKPKK